MDRRIDYKHKFYLLTDQKKFFTFMTHTRSL